MKEQLFKYDIRAIRSIAYENFLTQTERRLYHQLYNYMLLHPYQILYLPLVVPLVNQLKKND
jgi:hypothetical protein